MHTRLVTTRCLIYSAASTVAGHQITPLHSICPYCTLCSSTTHCMLSLRCILTSLPQAGVPFLRSSQKRQNLYTRQSGERTGLRTYLPGWYSVSVGCCQLCSSLSPQVPTPNPCAPDSTVVTMSQSLCSQVLSSHRELLSPLVSPLRCFLHHIGALHEEEILVPSNQHLSTLARAPCR